GDFVADELLPQFKGKFDLVERGQLTRLADELKLQGLADDDLGCREVGKAAKLRFLVVGSITPVNGITVEARMVDVTTGLIVQTARTTAAGPDDLAKQLPQLARVLMMNDDEKRAFEDQQAKDAVAVEVLKPDPDGKLPPLPVPPATGDFPLPII